MSSISPIPTRADFNFFGSDFESRINAMDAYEDALEEWMNQNCPGNQTLAWTSADGETFRLLSKEPSNPDLWRVTCFDTDGWPIGHSCFKTKIKALKETIGKEGSPAEDIPCPPMVEGKTESLLREYAQIVAKGISGLNLRRANLFNELTLFRHQSLGVIERAVQEVDHLM